jgi:putative peptide zinc metalloprotease protein
MTRKLIHRLISRPALGLLVAAAIALPAGGGAAIALADGGNTSAVAINTKDGSSVFRLAFMIRQVSGSVVDNQNAAVAYSSCTACQTVAISIQVLLISSDPTVFTPINEAIAINQNCTSCDTLAAAYQFAVGIGTRLKFTAAGRQQIADIRHQLEMLRNSGLSGPQIDAQVKTLMTQLATVLQTQLIGVNQPAGQANGASTEAATTPGGSSSTTPTTTTTTPPPSSTSTTPTTTTTPPSGTTPTTTASTGPTTTTTP